MTEIGQIDDTDIDIAIDEGEAGERRAGELANRIRMVAAQDPLLAQDLVEELIVALDRAMDGTIRDHLEGPARGMAERVLGQSDPIR
ncbi:hypothetical protein [Actinoplanes regularis]|uniref:Uncharacterized protein n=1 Tax=Actinoplanes regularis TaxID=52697 RepID=A0A239CCH4_9ACTN|nr:hypothetical protein [Actinoplanes regularis]GIE89473.1 hypothetical protein Are01nite_59530 [Actinoplanes regularis]GLW32143.1 hypothetical protein Areg01_50820 [Actinoplanes regularis]SNS17669.1 hypothetical protein SAMN06264365_11195 [Actinoplanes regularis]